MNSKRIWKLPFKNTKKFKVRCFFKILDYSFLPSWISHGICELLQRGVKQPSGWPWAERAQKALLKPSKGGLEIKGAEVLDICSTSKEGTSCRYISLTGIQSKVGWVGLWGKRIQPKKKSDSIGFWCLVFKTLTHFVIALVRRDFCTITPGKITTENLK